MSASSSAGPVVLEGTDELLGDSEDEGELDFEDPTDPEFKEQFVDLPGS